MPCPSPGPAWSPSRTADAILDLNLATDFDDFREAARSFAVPAQNLVYADRAGPHRVPGSRARCRSGAPPCRGHRRATGRRPGWDSTYDWQGFVEFSEHAVDPRPRGRRHRRPPTRPSRRSATPFLTTRLGPGLALDPDQRAARRAATRSAPADMAAIQMDTNDPFAKVLVPALLAVPLEATSETDPDSGRPPRVHPRGARAAARLGLHDPDGRRGRRRGRRLLQRRLAQPARAALRRRAAGRAQGRRRRAATAPAVAAAAHQPPQRLVGQQAHPQRHRGQGRDPPPGARRGPPRADPRARQGPRPSGSGASCTGSPSSTAVLGGEAVPGAGALARQRGSVRHAGWLGDRQRQRLERERGLRGDGGAVDADGRRPRGPRRVDVDQPDRGQRAPDRGPLRRPGRRLGRRSSAAVAVHARPPCGRPTPTS